jgi:hypothetical protein
MTDKSARILERATNKANAAASSLVSEGPPSHKSNTTYFDPSPSVREAENYEISREFTKRAKPYRIMKETFWNKLRELWAIRQRCQQIELQQRQNRLPRSNESYGGTQRVTKITSPKRRTLRSTGQSAEFSSGT